MAPILLSQLTQAGILERAGNRPSVLRVSPRFLAFAEGTAGRRRLVGLTTTIASNLEAALAGWDEFRGDHGEAARFLGDFLQERDQLGALLPVFPTLEGFGLAAA